MSDELTKLTLEMSPAMMAFLEAQANEEGFSDTAEYLKELVRREHRELRRHKRVMQLVEESLATDEEDIEVNEEYWKDFHARALELARERQRKIG